MSLALTAAAVAVLATACGGSDGGSDSEGSSVPYGARTCSDWAGRMDDGERWDAAEELLIHAKGTDGTDGDMAPSTDVIRQFTADMGAACEQGRSDDLLAPVADDLYQMNEAYYSL